MGIEGVYKMAYPTPGGVDISSKKDDKEFMR